MNPDALEKLKDIHLPEAVSWWPLAPGWWLLLGLFILMLALAFYLYKRSQRKSPEERIIEQSLEIFHQVKDQSLSPKELLMELSELLRRTAISLRGRDEVANLAGQAWLNFLNESGRTQAFTEGVGQAFADQPYRPEVEYNRQALLGLTHHWLQKQVVKTPSKLKKKPPSEMKTAKTNEVGHAGV